jgi:hypothetical protein
MNDEHTWRAPLFIMVVGPGEKSLALDTLESIVVCEPGADVWLLDDCTVDGTYDALVMWGSAHPGTRVMRNATPNGYRGIARSVFSLLAAAAAEPRAPEVVIKVDPDTCLIAPGIVDLMRQRFAASGPGITGPFRVAANGGSRTFDRQRRNMMLDRFPFGIHKDGRSIRVGPPFWSRFVAPARRNGYEPGEHVLGALSGMHAETLRAIHETGFFGEIPDQYRALTVEEDVLLGLATRAVGHQLIDLGPDPSESRIWIQFRPPVPHSAASLLERGILAVHPLKACPESNAMRAALRAARRPVGTPITPVTVQPAVSPRGAAHSRFRPSSRLPRKVQ